MGPKIKGGFAICFNLCLVSYAACFSQSVHLQCNRIHSPSSLFSQVKSSDDKKIDGVRAGAQRFVSIPARAVNIYSGYVSRLWRETNPEVRRTISRNKASAAIRQVQQIMVAGELDGVSEESKGDLISACDSVFSSMQKPNDSALVNGDKQVEVIEEAKNDVKKPATKKKKSRSVLSGALMGLSVACWVFSEKYTFTFLFTLMTILGQLEYYRMVMGTGVSPARRISIVASCFMFISALVTPSLHELCLPLFGLYTMIYFLTMKRSLSTIPEIATTFTGMFYLGFTPSFWVRVKTGPAGSAFLFWTWIAVAFSDVGAYFVGRRWGKTKLGLIAPAAGRTSPNKTVEGFLGGCLFSGVLSIAGAGVQKWPLWPLTGALHGIVLGFLGLIGDLTASMMKRDANVKDCGDLIPEHGGILDRVDSFVWSAPYSWLTFNTILPFLKQLV